MLRVIKNINLKKEIYGIINISIFAYLCCMYVTNFQVIYFKLSARNIFLGFKLNICLFLDAISRINFCTLINKHYSNGIVWFLIWIFLNIYHLNNIQSKQTVKENKISLSLTNRT